MISCFQLIVAPIIYVYYPFSQETICKVYGLEDKSYLYIKEL